MKRVLILFTLAIALTGNAAGPALNPYPKQVKTGQGSFTAKNLKIVVSPAIAEADANGAVILKEKLQRKGIDARIVRENTLPDSPCVVFDGFGGYGLLKKSGVKLPEKPLPEEGYFIDVSPKRIYVGAADRRGMVYAALTLAQLFDKQGKAPVCRIVDWPSLRMRCNMLQVPAYTVQGWNMLQWRPKKNLRLYANYKTAKDFLPILKAATQSSLDRKLNTIAIDINNVFRLMAYPKMALPESVPVEELKPIVELIRKYYADPVPLLDLFSHQEHFLAVARPDLMLVKLRQYPKKSVGKYDDMFYWEPVYDPHNPEVQKIVKASIDEVAALFKPKYIHVGHDECSALKFVKRKKQTEIPELFAYSVNFLRDYCKNKHNARIMIWGDMLLSTRAFNCSAHGNHQGAPTWMAIRKLPKDVIIADWQYYPFTRPYPGRDKPSRTDYPSSLYFTDNGFDVIGATVTKPIMNGKLYKRFKKFADHSKNFSRYVSELPQEKTAGKGLGAGMMLTNWYMNPVSHKMFINNRHGCLEYSAEHFWNGGKRLEPETFKEWKWTK